MRGGRGGGWRAGARRAAESSQLRGLANHLVTQVNGAEAARPVAGAFLGPEALRNGPRLFCYLGSFWPYHHWAK